MGFLWSDIGLELSLKSFRYHNDLIWYVYSLVGLVPLIMMTIYKLYINQVDTTSLMKNPKQIIRRWDDYVIVPLICWGNIYYLVDALISIFEGTMFEYCRFAMFYHHIICLVVMTGVLFKKIFYWWEALIPALHAVVVYGTGQFITYTYVVFIVFFNYRCYIYPYNQTPHYKFVGKFFPFIYYSFALVLIFDCNNPLPYLS